MHFVRESPKAVWNEVHFLCRCLAVKPLVIIFIQEYTTFQWSVQSVFRFVTPNNLWKPQFRQSNHSILLIRLCLLLNSIVRCYGYKPAFEIVFLSTGLYNCFVCQLTVLLSCKLHSFLAENININTLCPTKKRTI